MKINSVILLCVLLISFSVCKIANFKSSLKQHKLGFKKEYVLGSWIGKGFSCNGNHEDHEVVFEIKNGNFVGRKVEGGDDCIPDGGEFISGRAPSSWDNKSTYTTKLTKNPKWIVDANFFVKDIDTITTNQGMVFERKTPGAKDLYNSKWDRNYFLGTWDCDGYSCQGRGNIHEDVEITYDGDQGDKINAVKSNSNGDNCVTQGHTTFFGQLPDYLDPENFITVKFWVGNPRSPNASTVQSYCQIKDKNNFACSEIHCRRKTPYVPYVAT